ncbi:AbiJ-NTD4 domain-containing protein, partial [Bacteroides caecimuris]|uniref:AbiJ-NTD4 domain-containing protein n=2 Tax=Bacteroides TaxID=816 RepID=UPI0026F0CE68
MTFIPFSQRNGYVEVSTVIIRETLTTPIMNSIQNLFTELWNKYTLPLSIFEKLTAEFGRYYLNSRIEGNQHKMINPIHYMDYDDLEWYEKLDVIEWCLDYLYKHLNSDEIHKLDCGIIDLNKEFERHRYGYRLVKGTFIETTSNQEIGSIEHAISIANGNVQIHLRQALQSISPSNQTPDFRNSIKESISAVGSFLRENFGGQTLGDALNNMQKKRPNLLHRFIVQAIEKLYTYTNQSNTGIRHELLSHDYLPDHSDAIFMLVQSAS